jgi:pyruvate dehydrogenase E2 component (dihydrolipoamide acetyltransferase)
VTSEVVLPELGENVESAEVSAVLVAVGDLIRRDQPLIEVETEKASLEVPAPAEGRVTEVRVDTGDTIDVGQVILVLESDTDRAVDREPARTRAPGATPAVPHELPVSGIAGARPGEPDPTVAALRAASPRVPPEIGDVVPAAPSVRALARELGVEIRDVAGSGRDGRISRDDVKRFARRLIGNASVRGPSPRAAAIPARVDFSKWGEIRREPLTRIRRATAANLANAWATVPHVTQFDRADITGLDRARRELNRRPEAESAKLTVTAVVLEVVAAALGRFPKFNASLDLEAGEVVFKASVHVGVAVDTERGLLVPVVRDVDRKPLLKIATELAELAEKARAGGLTPDEMAGATFTVSNLGGLGTTHFSPIVNWPEVAILGVGRAETQVLYEEERFRPRLVLPLSLSYDHRLIDGADAARFLRWIAERLERPLRPRPGDTG